MSCIRATVTDANHQTRGIMDIIVSFGDGLPLAIRHDSRVYVRTGKMGHNINTGALTIELSSDHDARIWSSTDCTQIWED